MIIIYAYESYFHPTLDAYILAYMQGVYDFQYFVWLDCQISLLTSEMVFSKQISMIHFARVSTKNDIT
jgi:hypothetical protein